MINIIVNAIMNYTKNDLMSHPKDRAHAGGTQKRIRYIMRIFRM